MRFAVRLAGYHVRGRAWSVSRYGCSLQSAQHHLSSVIRPSLVWMAASLDTCKEQPENTTRLGSSSCLQGRRRTSAATGTTSHRTRRQEKSSRHSKKSIVTRSSGRSWVQAEWLHRNPFQRSYAHIPLACESWSPEAAHKSASAHPSQFRLGLGSESCQAQLAKTFRARRA